MRKKEKVNKTGQMEIIGLVVIVILITLGMLFMAMFAFKEKPEKKVFLRKGLAYSTMGALMKMEAECEDYNDDRRIKYLEIAGDLIKDCAENKGFDSRYGCGGKHSCDFLKELIKDLLGKTLGKWHKHYEFSFTLADEPEPSIPVRDKDEQGCPETVEKDSSGLFPLDTGVGIVYSVLYLCD